MMIDAIVFYNFFYILPGSLIDLDHDSKHGRYEENWLNSLHVMSNMKIFVTKDG